MSLLCGLLCLRASRAVDAVRAVLLTASLQELVGCQCERGEKAGAFSSGRVRFGIHFLQMANQLEHSHRESTLFVS